MSAANTNLGVAGNPIAHSMSPDIHHGFARSLGHDVDYQRLCFPLDGFDAGAREFFATGGLGLNVTVPFKREAYEYSARLDPLAAAAGAVNTLAMQHDEVVGYNTDGIGLVRDLEDRHQVKLSGLEVLVLGAGGACQGIVQPLLDAGVRKITIANRTLAKAVELVNHFRVLGRETFGSETLPVSSPQSASSGQGSHSAVMIEALDLTQLATSSLNAQLVINSTAIGLDQNVAKALHSLPANLAKGRICYDLSYGAQAHFARWASVHQASQAFDGLGMLVEQAAASYAIWMAKRPSTESVYEQLRGRLA